MSYIFEATISNNEQQPHMQHPHSIIAFITGGVSVSVPTAAMESLFSANTGAELVLFALKGIIGGVISIGITRMVDTIVKRVKERNNKPTT